MRDLARHGDISLGDDFVIIVVGRFVCCNKIEQVLGLQCVLAQRGRLERRRDVMRVIENVPSARASIFDVHPIVMARRSIERISGHDAAVVTGIGDADRDADNLGVEIQYEEAIRVDQDRVLVGDIDISRIVAAGINIPPIERVRRS